MVVEVCKSWTGVHHHLGISSVVCGVVGEILQGERYVNVSIKVICYLFLSVLSIECQRARADIVFMFTFKRFFFLTLDGIAFDNFLPVRISLFTFTLHISVEIFQCYFKKIMGDNCQFLFQQQSSLVIFFKICFFFYFRFCYFSQ